MRETLGEDARKMREKIGEDAREKTAQSSNDDVAMQDLRRVRKHTLADEGER